MKKILSIALVALLATSAVFAGFSGNASVALGYNWETGAYGFSNGTGFDLELDLATAEAEAVAEGSVHAGIKANFALKVANREGSNGTFVWADGRNFGLGLFLDLEEAYVGGENWKVSITGTKGAPDYAKSAIDTKKADVNDIFGNVCDEEDVAVSYKVSSNKAPGVTVELFDWKASVGFNGSTNKDNAAVAYLYDKVNKVYNKAGSFVFGKWFNYNAFVETPKFDFDVVTLQAAVIASRKTNLSSSYYYETEKEMNAAGPSLLNSLYDNALGVSAKVGFDADIVTGSVAADFGMVNPYTHNGDIKGLKPIFGMDVAANLAISPVTVDLFYMNKDLSNVAKKEGDALLAANTLSAQVKFDLADFSVPVAITAYGKDMLNKAEGQDFGAKVEVAIDAFSVTGKGGYVLGTDKLYLGAEVGYKHDLFAVKGGVNWSMKTTKNLKDTNVLAVSASVESKALIPGATLSLAYGAASEAMNLLDQAGSGVAQNFGKVEAKCKIAF